MTDRDRLRDPWEDSMSIAPRVRRATVNPRARIAAAALLSPLAAIAPVPAASAAIDPASYHHVDVFAGYPAPWGLAGGYIACPAGMKAVASGATSPGLRDNLTASLTTFDQSGALVTARGQFGGRLQLSARCVAAAQLQGSTLATTAIRDHRPTGHVHIGRATCPPGTVAYGGGGFVNHPLGADVLYASMPEPNATEWTVAAAGSLYPNKELSISTHCLPQSQFGQITTVSATDTAPNEVPRYPNYPVLSAAPRCPAGFYAYAGGAWLQRSGSTTPVWVGYLTVSNMAADDRGGSRAAGPSKPARGSQPRCTA